MKALALILGLLISTTAAAELRLGIGASASRMTNTTHDCPACDASRTSEHSLEPAASLEYRHGSGLGLMLSYGQADRESENRAGPRYFAAKGDPSGAHLQTHIKQSIRAHWIGLQATYTHEIAGIGLRVMAGAARVSGANYERGTYDEGSGEYWVAHENATQEIRPMFGIGAELPIAQHFAVKLEWQRITSIVRSYWTKSNRADAIAAELVLHF